MSEVRILNLTNGRVYHKKPRAAKSLIKHDSKMYAAIKPSDKIIQIYDKKLNDYFYMPEKKGVGLTMVEEERYMLVNQKNMESLAAKGIVQDNSVSKEVAEELEKVDSYKVEKLEKPNNITPAANKLCQKHGLNPADIVGSGDGGKITVSDVKNLL